MRTISYKLLLLLLLFPSLIFAARGKEGKYKKEKKIEKTYIVNSDVQLEVDNTYGNIYVSTWDENKTAIEVSIKISGDKEDAVSKKMEAISIYLKDSRSLITAKTIIDKNIKSIGTSLNIEINYTIQIPKNGSVRLENKYGDIIIGKLIGQSDITCRYGRVIINELQNQYNQLVMEYSSNSTIGYFNEGVITAKYSDFLLDRSNKLNLKSAYTDMKIKNVETLFYKSTYGKISVDNAGLINGSGNYLTLNFGKINQQLDLVTSYSQLKITEINVQAKDININSGYTNMVIGHNANYPFNFIFKLNYCNLSNNSNLEIQSKNDSGPQVYYKGYYKKSGVNTINIISNYGNVKLIKN